MAAIPAWSLTTCSGDTVVGVRHAPRRGWPSSSNGRNQACGCKFANPPYSSTAELGASIPSREASNSSRTSWSRK